MHHPGSPYTVEKLAQLREARLRRQAAHPRPRHGLAFARLRTWLAAAFRSAARHIEPGPAAARS